MMIDIELFSYTGLVHTINNSKILVIVFIIYNSLLMTIHTNPTTKNGSAPINNIEMLLRIIYQNTKVDEIQLHHI